MKITFHLITGAPFVEPTGLFAGDPSEWNELLLVSSFGGVGYLTAVLFCLKIVKNTELPFLARAGHGSADGRRKHWLDVVIIGSFVVVTIFCVVNTWLGINISGLAPLTILPWPMNTVITWVLGLGFGIVSTLLMLIEFNQTKKIRWSFALLLFEAFLSSVSTLSRGLFLFHSLPLLYLIVKNRAYLKKSVKSVILTSISVGLLFVISFSLVSIQRTYMYGAPGNENQPHYTSFFSNRGSIFNGVIFSQFSRLVIDRWIGAEGVMAVIAYNEKSLDFMLSRLVYKPQAGESDIYSKMTSTDLYSNSKYVVTSIPGPMAFFYYSNSFFVVLIGMFLLVLVFYALEVCIYSVFQNVFLSYFMAFQFANHIAQFGIFPRQLLVFYLMTSFALFCVYIILMKTQPKTISVGRPRLKTSDTV
ncbi:MAG: hypothetical protein IPM97_07730 [Bdellovibrionaceae bacterium]|nr:hypothetical protein [Pseudobdellovibrionaceae bacterium]